MTNKVKLGNIDLDCIIHTSTERGEGKIININKNFVSFMGDFKINEGDTVWAVIVDSVYLKSGAKKDYVACIALQAQCVTENEGNKIYGCMIIEQNPEYDEYYNIFKTVNGG